MRKEDKGNIIAQLGEVLNEYAHFYLVDVTGLNAATTSAMRRKCFQSEIKMVVVKNTLLHKALEAAETDYTPLYDCLKGTTAVLFANTANAPAKLLKDFAKDGMPALKAAYAEEGFYVGADQLEALTAMKLLLRLWLCCSHQRRTYFLLFNQVETLFMEFSKLSVKDPNKLN